LQERRRLSQPTQSVEAGNSVIVNEERDPSINEVVTNYDQADAQSDHRYGAAKQSGKLPTAIVLHVFWIT
jgi:hypothetical protein